MKNRFLQTKGGYTLPELVIYIAVLAVVVAIIVVGLLQFRTIRSEVNAEKIVGTAALQAFDRVMYEVRNSSEVDVANSDFGIADGTLVVLEEDGGSNTSKAFSIVNGRLEYEEDGVVEGFITDADVEVTEFFVYQIPTTEGEAVTMRLTLQALDSDAEATTFYNTAVLRGAYQ